MHARFLVRHEDGEKSEFALNLWELPQVASVEMEGRTWVRVKATLPVQLPLGYHEISLSVDGSHTSTRWIVTPERAYMDPHLGRGGRAAGIAVSLYGVRSERNWGCGDFQRSEERDRLGGGGTGSQFRGAESAARHPQPAAVQHQPVPAELHLLSELPLSGCGGHGRFQRCRRAQALRNTPEVAREIEELRATPYVEYERVSALKLRFLKVAFVQFLRERRSGIAQSARVRSVPRARGRPAGEVRHLLRAGRRVARGRIPTCGCGPSGRRLTRTPARRRRRRSAKSAGAA